MIVLDLHTLMTRGCYDCTRPSHFDEDAMILLDLHTLMRMLSLALLRQTTQPGFFILYINVCIRFCCDGNFLVGNLGRVPREKTSCD